MNAHVLSAFSPYTSLASAWLHAAASLSAFASSAPFSFALCVVGALSFGTFLIPWLLTFLTHTSRGARTLKGRYGAEWAVVTGGSSGIGLSLCRRLAEQSLNIVMVAFPEPLLATSAAALAAEFPRVKVRSVGLNLGLDASTYLPQLAAATADIPVSLVFNNAGYIVTGFFADTPLERWLANAQCNAVAPIAITHLFLARMRAEGRKGCITFTSRCVLRPAPCCWRAARGTAACTPHVPSAEWRMCNCLLPHSLPALVRPCAAPPTSSPPPSRPCTAVPRRWSHTLRRHSRASWAPRASTCASSTHRQWPRASTPVPMHCPRSRCFRWVVWGDA